MKFDPIVDFVFVRILDAPVAILSIVLLFNDFFAPLIASTLSTSASNDVASSTLSTTSMLPTESMLLPTVASALGNFCSSFKISLRRHRLSDFHNNLHRHCHRR